MSCGSTTFAIRNELRMEVPCQEPDERVRTGREGHAGIKQKDHRHDEYSQQANRLQRPHFGTSSNGLYRYRKWVGTGLS